MNATNLKNMEAEKSASFSQPEINPFLKKQLEPLSDYYSDPNTVEIRVNREGQVVVDRRGKPKEYINDERLTSRAVKTLVQTVANCNSLSFHPVTSSKVSCTLPGGHRFEAIYGASPDWSISIAIRCKHPFKAKYSDFGCDDKVIKFLKKCMYENLNIIISGTTNTGKTTLLNLLLEELDEDARVLAMEDTPEISMERFPDGKRLIAAREQGKGEGLLTWRELYDHGMRATPDHILFGEISSQNASPALSSLTTGITGYACTIHATNPNTVATKFEQNILLAGDKAPNVQQLINDNIDAIIQIKRSPNNIRKITDIYLPKTGEYLLEDKEDWSRNRYNEEAA